MTTLRLRASEQLHETRRLLRRLRATFRPGSAPDDRPLPRVTIATSRSVSAWGLRLVLIVVGVVCILLIGHSGVARVILGAALIGVVLMPGGVATGAFAVGIGLSMLTFEPGGLPAHGLVGVGPVLLAAIHLIAVLGSLLGQVPLRTAVELRALLPTARRYVVIQAGAQILGLAAGWISERAVVVTALPILAALALVAGAAWLIPRLHRHP